MSGLARSLRHPLVRAFVALLGLGLCTLAVLRFALSSRLPPERCPAGMTRSGQRCCGDGQHDDGRACAGAARSCSSAQERTSAGECVARYGVVSLPGGELFIGAADWDGVVGTERFPRTHVAAFRLDAAEVTLERWRGCQGCSAREGEPGLPVRDVSAEDAERFCRGERGRLPTAAEWVWAAAGAAARRYAWGSSGLVCRRAAFGLVDGPCGRLGGPELSGSRPDGGSPDGVHDLAGNVAEWTREAGGGYTARGGSFRSRAAAELKSWATLPDRGPAPYIGFRCAYSP